MQKGSNDRWITRMDRACSILEKDGVASQHRWQQLRVGSPPERYDSGGSRMGQHPVDHRPRVPWGREDLHDMANRAWPAMVEIGSDWSAAGRPHEAGGHRPQLLLDGRVGQDTCERLLRPVRADLIVGDQTRQDVRPRLKRQVFFDAPIGPGGNVGPATQRARWKYFAEEGVYRIGNPGQE